MSHSYRQLDIRNKSTCIEILLLTTYTVFSNEIVISEYQNKTLSMILNYKILYCNIKPFQQ